MIGLSGQGAGVGHPDAMTGHGYFSSRGSAGNRTYPMQRGFPYDELDLTPDPEIEYEEDEDDDELAVKLSRKTHSNYSATDTMGMHAKDRRSFADSSLLNVSSFTEQRRRLREINASIRRRIHEDSTIRSRPRSSEPDSGTIYGWSSQPMWNEPRRYGGVKRPRFEDIVGGDEEDEFEEYQEYLAMDAQEEQLLRRYIGIMLRDVRCRGDNFSPQRR